MPRVLVLAIFVLGLAGCPVDLSHWRQGAQCGDHAPYECPSGQTCAAGGTCLARCTAAGACEPDRWNEGSSLACQDDGLCHFTCGDAGGTCPTGLSCSDATNLCRGTAKPDILASGQDRPEGIAVDATSVYWTTSAGGVAGAGTVMKVALSGGDPVTLASGQESPESIAVDGTSVYWLNNYGGTVMKVPLAGGNPVTLASVQSFPRGIAVDATGVYWTNSDGAVKKVPLSGGAPVALASSSEGQPQDLAVNATSVFWTTSPSGVSNEGGVWRAPLAGGTPVRFATSQGNCQGITLDATSVYWTAFNDMTLTITVWKAPLSGGVPVSLASGSGTSVEVPKPIALDATHVYWTRTVNGMMDSGGMVLRVPLAGGAEVIVASGLRDPGSLAVDGTSVYFTAGSPSADGVIMRSPK
jgi:sugar lactone lactonase YvrE